MRHRFTIDGSDALETRLQSLCAEICDGIRRCIAPNRIEAIVLGGGYGRGEGGVLKTPFGDEPYNDIELYVFVRGNRLWMRRMHQSALHRLEQQLSAKNGIHIEFKLDSRIRLQRSPPTMFSYDLVSKHRVLWTAPIHQAAQPARSSGNEGRQPIDPSALVFVGCEHHLDPKNIPPIEATRLLFNRCTGLLLARELLAGDRLTADQSDFVGRNLAKMQLALGDALLATQGQYHWSCLERRNRLGKMPLPETEWLAQIRPHHESGIAFKLHPFRALKSAEAFAAEFEALSDLARRFWLWLENRRLNGQFATPLDYACSPEPKCDGSAAWRNLLLNIMTFGPGAALDRQGRRYPRERLFNALPLLLWAQSPAADPKVKRQLQQQLRTRRADWVALAAAYKAAWPRFS